MWSQQHWPRPDCCCQTVWVFFWKCWFFRIFTHSSISDFNQSWHEKRKTSSEHQFLFSGQRKQDRLAGADTETMVTQITTPNRVSRKASDWTTHPASPVTEIASGCASCHQESGAWGCSGHSLVDWWSWISTKAADDESGSVDQPVLVCCWSWASFPLMIWQSKYVDPHFDHFQHHHVLS